MLLLDSSVWVDHFRHPEPTLIDRLNAGKVLGHPLVRGEIALGHPTQGRLLEAVVSRLPKAIVAREDEVLAMIARDRLGGTGIGYVDAHLLASARLTPDAGLWTRDKRLAAVAGRLGLLAIGP